MRSPTKSLLVGSALLFAACGGMRHKGEQKDRAIDHLRAQAEKHPDDPKLALELAIGEHLYNGGEAARARAAVAHAHELAARAGGASAREHLDDTLALWFLDAEQHVLEGEPRPAFDAYVALLEHALTSSDPNAPYFIEVALSSLADMNDAVDDYRPRIRDVLLKLHAKGDAVGLQVAHQARMGLLAQATQAGDLDALRGFAVEAGCLQRFDVAGPFGPRELLSFDQALPPEAPGPFAASYDLGPARGVRPVRTVETHRCAFGIGRGAHDAMPGSTVLRSEFDTAADRAGLYALRIESPNSFVVQIDGKEFQRSDARVKPSRGVRYFPLSLAAGKHELKLKVTSRHPNPAVSLALVRAEQPAIDRTALPEPHNEVERFLVAKLALARGDAIGARELIRKLGQAEPTAHWLILEGATALADPLKTAELRRDRARELLTRAGKQNDRAWYPKVGVARLASAEGRTKEAIEALREAKTRWPEATSIRTALVEQLRDAGYIEEADLLVDDLAKQLPNACVVANLSLQSARNRGRIADVVRLSERAMQCDATSGARLAALKTQQKYDEAAAELTRLEALGEPLDASQRLETELERARLKNDVQAVQKLRVDRSEMWPDRPDPVLERADLLLAAGDKAGALKFLASDIEKNPGDLYELRRVEDAITADELFKDFRKNGPQVIKAYEAAKRTYEQPQVLVLDYTAQRLFEDGSSVSLTHNIIRVQSQEAVDDNGEFSVPEGARLLSLHTIKADGTRLEPDVIPGKSTWSLPNLAPGDYVEFEYLRGESPSAGFPGGYLGDRFYFQSFEIPFNQSELVVVLPDSMEPVLDPRGPLPAVVKEKRKGLHVLRWTALQSQALSPESSSVASREFLPSINLGVKVSWPSYVESLRDLLVDKDMFDPAAQQFVEELLRPLGQAGNHAKAAFLYRWVTDQIESTSDVFGSAPAMLSARTGSRERILKYMLALASIPSELVLARGIEADHSTALLPDPETYGYLLLRIATEKGPVLVHAGARHAPFGYLPDQVRGESALVINEKAEVTATPVQDLDDDRRTIDLDVEVTAEGGGAIHVREEHRGAGAVEWRNDLDQIPAAELQTRFEQSYAANVIPGARLKSLKIEAREQPEAPLVIDYEVEVSDLGQRTGNQQRIAGLFPTSLAPRYARQGRRTTTEIVSPAQAIDVHTRVRLPKGAHVVALPKGGVLTHPSRASFEATAEAHGEELKLERKLRLPIARVTPEEYAGFASFCRGADAIEASELVVDLPAAH